MYLDLLEDSNLYKFLFQIDQDLAEQAGRSPCRFCGARLHSACYLRRPRGLPAGIDPGPGFGVCFSFCCSGEGCRRRHRPPSVRFLGPKVYLAVCVALITFMRQGSTPRTTGQLKKLFRVDRRTLSRWRRWWQTIFPITAFWRRMRARFMPPVKDADLPQSLIERFTQDAVLECVMAMLRFLSTTMATPF